MKTEEGYIQKCFDVNQTLYLYLCRNLVSNHTRRSKHHLQPLTYDFIDASTSKTKKIVEIDSVPHTHSLVLVENPLKEQYLHLSNVCLSNYLQNLKLRKIQYLEMSTFDRALLCIESVDTQEVDGCDLKKVILYASKLLQHPVSNRLSLMNMLPNLSSSSPRIWQTEVTKQPIPA